MMAVEVDGISFSFPDGWVVDKYDDWSFYRNQFVGAAGGMKAVDLLAQSDAKTLWMIEVKDYRGYQRTKAIDLDKEIALKVVDTLAGLLPAKLNSSSTEERTSAAKYLRAKKVRVVLHLELPTTQSRLFHQPINSANVQMKLRTAVKAIDAHPLVVSESDNNELPWTATAPLDTRPASRS